MKQKPKNKLKKLSVSIPEELFKKLEKDAEQTMCSISFIVRDALRQYYQNKN
jgi:metal-responsive CopG/Arc/MetJ family transcriptional regulator